MILKWHSGEVPEEMKVKQVYGVLFTEDGRILLKIDEGFYAIIGGKPEKFDKDREATLRREVLEEVNTTIDTPIMIGYQEVDEEDGHPPYAQVRMTAMIKNIGELKPDPDCGKTYTRILTVPSKAISYMNWGDIGESIINEALEIAKSKFGLKEFLDKDEIV